MEENQQLNPNPPVTLSLSSTSPPLPPLPTESDTPEPASKKPRMSTTTDDDESISDKPRRYKRRKVAIFLAYCGVGYLGMQKNPGAKTIEGDLEEALYLTGAVPEDERGQHKCYDWARSARTDKGVSAVGQVVSGRFFVDPPGFVQRLNSVLSPQIRIFGYKRATPSFNAKKFCDRRRYVYFLPVFALDPSCHRDRESVMASLGSGEELIRCVECSERGRKVSGVIGNRRGMRNVGLVQSGILSNSCDTLMLDAVIKVNDDIENGDARCLKNGVGVEVLAESGILSNNCDASMLQVKEEGCNVCVKSENVAGEELKNDVAVEKVKELEKGNLVQLDVPSTSVDEKVKELEEGNLRVKKEKSVGEELKNDVGVVKSEVLAQSGVQLNKEDVVSLNAEVDASMLQVKEEGCNVCVENENVAGEELKNDVVVEKVKELEKGNLVQSDVSLTSADEKVKELEEGNLRVEKEKNVGEELKNDVGVVKSDVLVQSGVQLNKEDVVSLNAEVEAKEECPRTCEDDNGETELESNGTGEGTKGTKCDFKYGDEVKERFNRILKYYEGTHNFHNFTTRTKAEDPSAKRYIVSFQANTTLTLEGIEFIKCEVVGQSFMLHQIRKMMGMAVAVMRNFAPESIFETAFDRTVYLNVPTAPEVGLYLDECFFTSYNNKWHGTHEELSMKSYAEEAEEFKLKYIYSHIAEAEQREGAVAIWLHSLNRRNYPDLCHPSPKGVFEGDTHP